MKEWQRLDSKKMQPCRTIVYINKKKTRFFIDSCRQGWHMLVDMALTQGFRNHLNFCSKRNYKLKIVLNIWAVGLDYYMLGSYTMEITAERESK